MLSASSPGSALSPAQQRHFDTFGFITLRQLFTSNEVATLREEYEAELTRLYPDAPFDGSSRHWAVMLSERTPLFASLLEDERFCAVAEQLYGEVGVGMQTDANRYVGDTGWHADHMADSNRDVYGVKFAMYLDTVGADSGALRIVPGSQRRAFHEQVAETLEHTDLAIDQVPAHVCVSEPGDVVAFDMRCWHASSGGSDGRRMCTSVFYSKPQGAKQQAAARERAEGARNTPRHFGRPDGELYPASWLANRGNSPRRARWIGYLEEYGYLERESA